MAAFKVDQSVSLKTATGSFGSAVTVRASEEQSPGRPATPTAFSPRQTAAS